MGAEYRQLNHEEKARLLEQGRLGTHRRAVGLRAFGLPPSRKVAAEERAVVGSLETCLRGKSTMRHAEAICNYIQDNNNNLDDGLPIARMVQLAHTKGGKIGAHAGIAI